jgi:hypothetical protein
MFKIIDGAPVAYSIDQLKNDNPGLLFPRKITPDWLNQFDIVVPSVAVKPTHNSNTHFCEINELPDFVDGQWVLTWTIKPLSADQLAEHARERIAEIKAAIQQRLDQFAQGRYYNDITSACTYATSKNATFAAEGQYCVDARDATWGTAFQILKDFEAGDISLPEVTDVEAALPPLQWPTN